MNVPALGNSGGEVCSIEELGNCVDLTNRS